MFSLFDLRRYKKFLICQREKKEWRKSENIPRFMEDLTQNAKTINRCPCMKWVLLRTTIYKNSFSCNFTDARVNHNHEYWIIPRIKPKRTAEWCFKIAKSSCLKKYPFLFRFQWMKLRRNCAVENRHCSPDERTYSRLQDKWSEKVDINTQKGIPG